MKKHIAASAALLLLTVLVCSFSDYSSEKNMDADIARQDTGDVIEVDHIKVAANAQQLSDNPPSARDSIVESLGWSLTIDFALRNHFDDIIHEHRLTQSDFTDLLAALAIEMSLSQDANNQLVDLFERYQQYLLAIDEVKKEAPAIQGVVDIAEAQRWFEDVYALQYQYFNEEEIAAFFSKEKNYDQQALARLAIRQDSSLNQVQKQALLNHQASQLEPEEFAVIQPTFAANSIVKILTDNVDAATTLNELNLAQLARVEQTKKENADWKLKVKNYQNKASEFQALGDDYAEALSQYQNDNFSPNEMKRLQVFINNPELLN